MGMGWMKGDWKAAEKKTRKINLIEPVVEEVRRKSKCMYEYCAKYREMPNVLVLMI